MKILVTGGLGVNGCWVTRDLLAMGHEPVVFDARPDFSLLRDISDAFAFVNGDITSLEQLESVCREHKIERICHLAAVYPEAADYEPFTGFAINATATVNVLEAARRANCNRVIFTSSVGALSPMTAPHLEPEMKPVDEDFNAYPVNSVYGATKVASELMGIQYKRLFNIDFAALRFAAIYGIGKGVSRHGSHNVIWNTLIENAIAGKKTVIKQGGDQRLDFTYSRDVARSVTMACLADSFESHVFHIGSGKEYTMNDFVEGLKLAIPDADIEIGPGLDPREFGSSNYFRMDTRRAFEQFGYRAIYDPESAVKDWLQWIDRLELPINKREA
ncbi:MAG: NAD(P)-dependent oxidoreductase [SAR202 cluster bacterium]|nr:NAD(P)-dependent oxidoreductase [SAR202 cluster bacterium]|tara:strand:- start:1033 stop:2025 length:993 start_codon:yes stop_codon:yes gene_type:complete